MLKRQDSAASLFHGAPDGDASGIYASLPLDKEGLCVRILKIYAGQWSDPIRCRLVVKQLSGTTRYEAISYTWGTQWKSHTVTINGVPTKVTANLESALRHLRLGCRRRCVWVDAVCINQADLDERAAQVARMGQIYRNAEQVFVWLGEGTRFTDLAFRYMSWSHSSEGPSFCQAGQDCCPLHWHNQRSNWYLARGFHCPKCGEICWCDVCYRVQLDIGAGLSDVMSRPWWSRIWVVQEVAMAAGDPIVACGNSRIPWSVLLQAQPEQPWSLACIHQIRLDIKKPHRLRGSAAPLPYSTEAAAADDVLSWLRKTARFQASDPRDKIYALLGMARSKRWREIRPDYSISVTNLIRRLVLALVVEDKNLDIMTLCTPKHTPDETPSWMPDFVNEGLPYLATLKYLNTASPLCYLLERLPSYEQTISVKESAGEGGEVGDVAPGESLYMVLSVYGFRVDRVAVSSTAHVKLSTFTRPDLKEEMKDRERRELEIRFIRTFYYWFPVWRALHLVGVVDGNGNDAASFIHRLSVFLKLGQALEDMLDEMSATYSGSSVLAMKHRDYQLSDKITELRKDLREREANLDFDFWSKTISQAMQGRRFFVTAKGLLGIGPCNAEPDDPVVVLAGTSAAFILRENSGLSQLLGNAYVDLAPKDLPWSGRVPDSSAWVPENSPLEDFQIR